MVGCPVEQPLTPVQGLRRARAEARTGKTLRVLRVALLTLCLLGGLAAVGSWAQPWQYSRGNPDLSGVATGTASGSLVAGCPAGDGRNLINCVQYVDFDVGAVRVRHSAVRVTDGFRQSDENPNDLPIVYDSRHPDRFRLAEGNPGLLTRVLGTAWMSIVMVVDGGLLGTLGGGLLVGPLTAGGQRRLKGRSETTSCG